MVHNHAQEESEQQHNEEEDTFTLLPIKAGRRGASPCEGKERTAAQRGGGDVLHSDDQIEAGGRGTSRCAGDERAAAQQ